MSLYVIAAITGAAIGLLLIGAGVGGYVERRRAEREDQSGGRHSVGVAAGSSVQQGRVLGGDFTEDFNAITTAGFSAEELDRIRSTT